MIPRVGQANAQVRLRHRRFGGGKVKYVDRAAAAGGAQHRRGSQTLNEVASQEICLHLEDAVRTVVLTEQLEDGGPGGEPTTKTFGNALVPTYFYRT